MKAIKCDRCGKLKEESGNNFRSILHSAYSPTSWVRERVRETQVTITIEIKGSYGDEIEPQSCEICRSCFAELADSAVLELRNEEASSGQV